MLSRSRSGSRLPNPAPALARLALALALILFARPSAFAQTTPAPAPALQRAPAIERDEARQLLPAGEEGAPSPERLELDPSELRRRLANDRAALSPQSRPAALMRVRPLEGGYLDYNEEDQILYGPGRTHIDYKGLTLEADHVLLDAKLQEVQAQGNVEMVVKGNTIHASSLRYNFDQNEGVAFNVSGSYDPIFFHTLDKPAATGEPQGPPQMQVLSENEAIFKRTAVTTCDFTIPHYYVRGTEVVIFPKDRVFFRGATFYVMGAPVFYLPVYSRSMNEASPWFIHVGYNSRSGARIRLGYTYEHSDKEPSFDDDSKMITRSSGKADLYVDYLSKLGPGLGFDYTYQFEQDKHKGELSIYGLSDSNRQVFGPTPPIGSGSGLQSDSTRWRFMLKHRSQITDDLSLLINIDEFSDPDLFYDVLDLFNGADKQHREIERRARVALTFMQEAYVVRLMADVKDRIGLDRLNDFSDPRDNNRDFDLDPYNSIGDNTPDGISGKRWGRVSSKLPQLDVASRWLPFAKNPWYYAAELHLYNSLDKGINIVGTEDDAYVQGGEFYQQVMRQWKLSDRYTLLAKAGVGIGGADRDRSLGITNIRHLGTEIVPGQDFPRQVDGLIFTSPDTFLVGNRKKSFSDLTPSYFWADASLQLNARFSDALRGWVRWRGRETTGDFVGDWYASLGDRTVRDDLYNYKLREDWLEGQLTYSLFRPLLSVYAGGGVNLIGNGQLYPQEPAGYWNAGGRWTNQRQTVVADAGIGMTRRQIFDPTDPRSLQENEFSVRETLTYAPVHKRWYLEVENSESFTRGSSSNVEAPTDNRLTFFTDQGNHGEFKVTYGRELGPKWTTEIAAAYDYQIGGLGRVSWLLERDMHDAVASLEIRSQNNTNNATSSTSSSGNQIDVRTGLKFKLPAQEPQLGPGDVRTLRQQARQPAVSY